MTSARSTPYEQAYRIAASQGGADFAHQCGLAAQRAADKSVAERATQSPYDMNGLKEFPGE